MQRKIINESFNITGNAMDCNVLRLYNGQYVTNLSCMLLKLGNGK